MTKTLPMTTAPDGFSLISNFLTINEQTELLCQISAFEYQEASFRGKRLKRTTSQFGYAYILKGKQLAAAEPMPPFLLALAQKALANCSPQAEFNQCIITRYQVSAGIGWHVDAPRFGDLVVGISLAGSGRFQFRPKRTNLISFETELTSGSMYLIDGCSRWDYEHRLMPVKEERYSIGFRYVAIET
ncbi:alpha-ketoglutarate-dependent dioxygenase AlkB [Chamaesiphon sp. VAR_48_metabat_403]|uniref:alpha-ketoglutarate-dependent dioxygenase AlkB n=1 Tax=Chamaesiphon sp. VAR_48_metabat_403 TaxID=2964700 RepID=UPI00286D6E60|nr:alpha-ketoglutarate-dependent dioxygenase AlkB [Chamaesiphon sp. VAR_48_metabat_403]